MMTMNRYLSIAGLLTAALLSACEKNAVQEIAGPAPSSRILFFNFGVGAPAVNFYANDAKMTATLSTTGSEATTGVNFGGVGAGGAYTGIAPGTYTLAGKISAATDKDLAISNLSTTIADGKFYSYYLSGPYNTTSKTVDSFIVEDPIPELDFTKAYVRFVNAISNSSPMVLKITNSATDPPTVTAIGGPVAYKSAGAYVAVPEGNYTIATQLPGSSANAIVRTTAVAFSNGRVYTIAARGTMAATGTAAPFLDNTANR